MILDWHGTFDKPNSCDQFETNIENIRIFTNGYKNTAVTNGYKMGVWIVEWLLLKPSPRRKTSGDKNYLSDVLSFVVSGSGLVIMTETG